MNSAKIRVLCVDDSEDVPAMMGRCIGAEPDMESVGHLHCADELLSEVKLRRADVVLLDMSMPGKDPLDALRELRAESDRGACESGPGQVDVRVIAYSGRNDQRARDMAGAAGAWGYLCKDSMIPVVLRAIRDAAAGGARDRGGLSSSEGHDGGRVPASVYGPR